MMVHGRLGAEYQEAEADEALTEEERCKEDDEDKQNGELVVGDIIRQG